MTICDYSERDAAERRRRRGQRAERWGRSAELCVERRYAAQGGRILDRRVKTEAGEIDLVVALGDIIVFAEVKARKTRAAAMQAIRPGSWARRGAAAELYAAMIGHRGDFRLDVAAVDRAGEVEIVENASLAAAF